MIVRFVRKNDYRDELEIRGFPVDHERYEKMAQKQREYDEKIVERQETKKGGDKQTRLEFR